MRHYNLGFISDEDIFNHIKDTVKQYRKRISLKTFNSNIIDPIKLTFDSKIYGQTMRQTIEAECIRRITTRLGTSIKTYLGMRERVGVSLLMENRVALMF